MRDPSETAVVVAVEVRARPETVWRCLVERDLLSRWLGAVVDLEPTVGAPVRVDFARHRTVVAGQVLEVVPGRRLAISWGVESGPSRDAIPAGSTRVTFDLAPTPSGTRLTLRHDGLPTEGERRDHDEGWREYLASLSDLASRTDPTRAVR